MSSKQYLIDVSTRRQVFLQRYADGQAKTAIRSLNRMRRDINARLAREPAKLTAQRLTAIHKDIEGLISRMALEVGPVIKKGATDLAESEAIFSASLYSKASNADFLLPQTLALISAVENTPMVPIAGAKSVNIDEALQQFGVKKAAGATQIINDGIALGDTTQVIAKRLDTVIKTLHKRQLAAIAKTATNHASSVARMEVYKSNADLIDGYEWVATLDGKTTFICGSRDGKKFIVGSGPLPPAHWNCRSTTIPAVKSKYNIGSKLKGKRPSVGPEGAELVGANTSYGGWLKNQPAQFVDEAIGVERSRLLRSGKLTIEKFVDPTGRVYTLKQLESMNPFVFSG